MAKIFGRSIFSIASRLSKRVLDVAQGLFNRRVKSGEFDLQVEIETHEWAGDGRAGRKAIDWFKTYVRDKPQTKFKGRTMEAGKLYLFRYMMPKHKDTLAFFDTNPLVLCLGHYLAGNGEIIEMGLNMHLLPPKIRRIVISKVFSMYSKKYNGEMYSTDQRSIELRWQMIALPLLRFGAAFGFRSYIPRLRTQTVEFLYEDWPSAIYIPSLKYSGTDEDRLKAEWRKFTIEQGLKKLTASGLEDALGGIH